MPNQVKDEDNQSVSIYSMISQVFSKYVVILSPLTAFHTNVILIVPILASKYIVGALLLNLRNGQGSKDGLRILMRKWHIPIDAPVTILPSLVYAELEGIVCIPTICYLKHL
jgi:hypothetical protein